jgi:Na+-driven multidrug efflux pump
MTVLYVIGFAGSPWAVFIAPTIMNLTGFVLLRQREFSDSSFENGR